MLLEEIKTILRNPYCRPSRTRPGAFDVRGVRFPLVVVPDLIREFHDRVSKQHNVELIYVEPHIYDEEEEDVEVL